MIEKTQPRSYLGDGVYARFDGAYIHLAVNDHRNEVVAIEPEVMNALLRFADTVFKPNEYRKEQ
jgi:hypothetical protein